MSWRNVVISSRCKLELKLNNIIYRTEDKTLKIPISEVECLIIDNTTVSLTSALVVELVKNNVKIIFCDEKRNPISEVVGYYGNHNTSLKIRNQMKWDDEFKKIVWTEIVREKIRNQKNIVERYADVDSSTYLQEYIETVQIGDATNREGSAAKVYFSAIFGANFSRGQGCSVNAALNYGYAMLASMISKNIVYNGYITCIGIFHDNMFNKFNLTYDLIEIFRPIVDEYVLNMKLEKFDKEEKYDLLNIFNKKFIIDDKKYYLNDIISRFCRSFFECMEEKDISLLRFYKSEF